MHSRHTFVTSQNTDFYALHHVIQVPLAIATFHLSCVHTLILSWVFERKRPSFVNLTGCVLLIEGVFAFNVISYGSENLMISDIIQPGFLWANLAAIAFAVYSYIHETLLNDIPSEYALGLIGVINSLWAWIPSFISHEIGYEIIMSPGYMAVGYLALNGVTEVIAEYAAIFALRKTSSFIFNGTLTLASPIALLMMFLQNLFILHKSTRWSWMYIPTLFNIVIGCIYVYWKMPKFVTEKQINDEQVMHLLKDVIHHRASVDIEHDDYEKRIKDESSPLLSS